MPDLADILRNEEYADARRARVKHPDGWTPGVDTEKGVVVTASTSDETPQDWSAILEEFKLDPAAWEVCSDRVHVRTWDGPSGDRMFYFKADVRPRLNGERDPDVTALCREVMRWKKPKRTAPTGDHALIVCLSDWQLGKADGDGTAGTVDRVQQMIGDVVDRVAALRKAGTELGSLYVVGLGDLVEGCDGHYAVQTFTVELNRRDQVKLARRLLVRALKEWSPLFERVVVSSVPGNHAENRKNGKAFTTFGDNDDVAVFEQVAEVLAENPDRFGHVRFVIPDETLTVTLDVAGTIVSFAHGHQFGGGATPRAKAEKWWKGMQHARHPVGDADVLISGHFHHLNVAQDGPRLWVQCPTLDGGSQWWQEQGGSPSVAGTAVLVVGPNGARLPEVL